MSSTKPDHQSNPKPGTTAADAIAQIRAALKQLVGPTGLDIVPSPSSTPSPRLYKESDLHLLSRLPLSTTRRKLSAALSSLHAAAAARETWEPGKGDRLLRVKADTIAKSHRLRASKAALAESRRLAATADPFATSVASAIQRLRSIADQTGATTTEEPVERPRRGMHRLLTVCGTTFLADFTFMDVASGAINISVKFKHLGAEGNVEDKDVDQSFEELIRREDFIRLREAFDRRMRQEALSAAVSSKISLIDALRDFETDLLEAHDAERKAGCSVEDCMRVGHGVVKRSALGLNITFMKGHNALLGVEDAIPAREIAVSRSHPTIRQDLHAGAIPTSIQFAFAQTRMVAVNAQYVLLFDNPVIACLSVAQNLERVGSGGEKMPEVQTGDWKTATGGREVFSARGDARGEDGNGKKHHWPSLQTLLAPAVFGAERGDGEAPAREIQGDAFQTSVKEVVRKREHWSQQATEFIAAVALPGKQYMEFSHSGSDTVSGLAVWRVPLCHPRNVKPIFALIRQQIVFNELFKSCFASPIYLDKSRTPLQPQPVEVVLCDAPSFMSLNLYESALDDILSVAISVELGGDINVNLKLTSEQPYACSDAKASAILRACRSIPLTLMTIVKLGQKATAVRT